MSAAPILPFPSEQARQRQRRRLVEKAMRNARDWLDAGLAGKYPLEAAVAEATLALNVAARETTKAAIVAPFRRTSDA